MLQNCKTKEQVDLVFQWGSENPQTGYYFKRQVENFRESARYLKRVDTINPNNENNIKNKLIIGDNYDALNNLIAGGYKEKIDVIYIDPPYGMDNEGEFAKTNYENKVTRDELLSMLEPRLELAKQLLSSEGCIFCSIDDRNHAYVKMLFDKIFGESNFISCFPRITTTSGKNDEKLVGKSHDYVLMYSKTKIYSLLKDSDFNKSHYHNLDNDPRGLYQDSVVLDSNSLPYQKTLDFPIKFNNKTFLPGERNNQRGKVRWRWGKEKVEFGIKNNLIVEKNGRLYTKGYLNYDIKKINGLYEFVKKEAGKTIKSLLFDETKMTDEKYSNRIATKELLKLGINFDNPKPINLIKKIITLIPDNKNSIILDFFAGSGTTGQAVLELNKEDGGNRNFILCVNESGNSDEICKERLRRVITGKTSNNKTDFPWIESNKPLGSSLNIYEIKEASVHTDENCLLDKINEEDYDLPKFKTELAKIEWICDNFKVCTKKLVKEE